LILFVQRDKLSPMVVERIERDRKGKVDITTLIPGYTEKLSPPPFTTGFKIFLNNAVDEVFLDVISDDQIEIRYQTSNINGQVIDEPRITKLAKHDINEHVIKSKRAVPGRQISFRWRPARTYIDPLKERAIKDLLNDGTYTEEDAQNVRDQLIFEAQQDRDT
jgi:hypothetical protein